ncbi:MAG: class I SAM-dependent DNA methyltransferase [Dokdonella sp.]|uniref:class I SAM-dependent DNA methyltransferase n=1 Tax=Dokdonella sp. TaxID=2291710 RepID=UPI0025BA6C22|nr:DNA methyltransferase [Dokdonella sp.]MBZ0223020.1 class I SAM-dependent DNA methyltransferase [Dokdonella sp.]
MHDIDDKVDAFIARWQGADGRERANYQLFLTELATLLDLPSPEPAGADERANAYVFERRVGFRHGDGSQSWGYIDLYRRGCFVLEAKDVRETRDQRYDQGMLRARSQAENYARALPADEGRPPFVVVVDVGRSIEIYSEFSRSGATYVPFPDPRSHRIGLADLRDAALRERLRALWLDPLGLDPARRSAIVTREIAAHLAQLARSFERAGHAPQMAAGFLTRCLFTMFAEDVGLIPDNAFRRLLEELREQPAQLVPMLGELWRAMDAGSFSVAIRADLLRFNGKLFKQPDVLTLDTAQIELLIEAARADWREVEPAIFGTLLERALDPEERHALGAHYTPRAYVERLVLPTVIEPLREDWKIVQASALTLAAEGKLDAALTTLVGFHQHLCAVRVLDPACGSGNFLYVTLEHMKRLEGEVFNAFDELDPHAQAGRLRQGGLALDGARADPFGGETVDPHQLLGIELNPRAAAIAELVLWIGYLQWHFRTRGNARPPEPVLRDFHNIQCADAVLAWDRVEFASNEAGVPDSRWDGKTMKPSPITGAPIPDESARVPLERYINPRKATWPQADFVVGNPPFVGNKRMRQALGDGYAQALRSAWPEVPESADLVMYWWHHAAALTARGVLRAFGLITTNSLRQTFNRRVVEAALEPRPAQEESSANGASLDPISHRESGRGEGASLVPLSHRERGRGEGVISSNTKPSSGAARHLPPAGEGKALSLVFAIPDHPWVDAADGAAVRIAMTVGVAGQHPGRLLEVVDERADDDGEMAVSVRARHGSIHADLRIGADVASAQPLRANGQIALRGMTLVGGGFVLSRAQADALCASDQNAREVVIKPFLNGRDVTQASRDAFVIDFHGYAEADARRLFPATYQWVLDRVKPERMVNARAAYRERWWIFAEPRSDFRAATKQLDRYIATPMTARHRMFLSFDVGSVPDQGLVPIALSDGAMLGVLSSLVHVSWALATGGRLGVGNDPRYNNSRCFDPFPFPAASDAQCARIRALGEQIDAHRKRQQVAHPALTLTGVYNVLEKLRRGEALGAKERIIHEQGLVSVLRQLHDELDLAVLDAYGWSDLAPLLAAAHAIDPAIVAVALESAGASHAGERAGEAHGSIAEHPATRVAAATADPATSPINANATRAFDEAILERLVALNAERVAEERRGLVRWLRPQFQNPQGRSTPAQEEIDARAEAVAAPAVKKRSWPRELPDQVRAVAEVIAQAAMPLDENAIAQCFGARGRWRERLPTILDTLAAIGRIRLDAAGRYAGA